MADSNDTNVGPGALGEFALGDFVNAEGFIPSLWAPFSEPVRQKIAPGLAIALIASGAFQIVTVNYPEEVTYSRWAYQWSEPVRQKPGAPAYLQQAFTGDTQPIPTSTGMGWFAPLADPVKLKPGLQAWLQQTYTNDAEVVPGSGEFLTGWLLEFGKPVWPPKGLKSYLQQTTAYHPRVLPNPDVTAIMDATETNNDIALFAVNVYGSGSTATSGQGAKVSITEVVAGGNDPYSIRES